MLLWKHKGALVWSDMLLLPGRVSGVERKKRSTRKRVASHGNNGEHLSPVFLVWSCCISTNATCLWRKKTRCVLFSFSYSFFFFQWCFYIFVYKKTNLVPILCCYRCGVMMSGALAGTGGRLQRRLQPHEQSAPSFKRGPRCNGPAGTRWGLKNTDWGKKKKMKYLPELT